MNFPGGLESYHRSELRLPDISNHLENDWIPLASSLGISNSDISKIQADHSDNESQQALAMLRLWMRQSGNTPTGKQMQSRNSATVKLRANKYSIAKIWRY